MKKPSFVRNSVLLSNAIDFIHYLPRNCLAQLNPTALSRQIYYKRTGKELHLDPPVLFNEKLMWLKLHYYKKNPLITECADKYAVRHYIERCGLSYILNELIGVWNNVNDVDWETLPDKFAIKCNHGCGYNIICDNKSTFDFEDAKRRLNKWMNTDFWLEAAELNYKGIKHRIICEKYLGTEDNKLPSDYKIYCFNGVPKFLGIYHDRIKETHILKRGYYDFDWKPVGFMSMEIEKECSQYSIEKPIFLEELYRIAKTLASPFPFVRVDLYVIEKTIVFGELTFTPAFCTGTMFNDDGMKLLGDWIQLPIE